MKTLAISALALCVFATSNANAITHDYSPLETTVSGLDAYVVSSSPLNYRFALPDGQTIPKVTISLKLIEVVAPENGNPFGYVRVGFIPADGHQTGGLAFSYSTIKWNWGDRSVNSTGLLPRADQSENFALMPFGSVSFTLTDLYFGAGKGLNPSSDSACAAFSCMLPYTTKGMFTVDILTSPLPEPESIIFGIAGLAVVGAVAAKRKRLA